MKSNAIAIRAGGAVVNCRYDKMGHLLSSIMAGLALPLFLLSGRCGVQRLPYLFSTFAAVMTVLASFMPERMARYICRISAILYACYIAAQGYGSIIGCEEVNSSTHPSLFLSFLRLGAGLVLIACAVMQNRLSPRTRTTYWSAVKSAAVIAFYSDILQIIAMIITLDADIFLLTNPYELLIRIPAELWFAITVMVVLHPSCVNINYRRLKLAIRDYILVAVVLLPIFTVVILLVVKKIAISLLAFAVSGLSLEIMFGMQLHRGEKEDEKRRHKRKSSNNYVKTFCSKRWAYSYLEIKEVAEIQRRLNQIEFEVKWADNMASTEDSYNRLCQLDEERRKLDWRLFWKYSLDTIRES